MSCCLPGLSWAWVSGQLHSLRPACHLRAQTEEAVATRARSPHGGLHKPWWESGTQAASQSLCSELMHPLVCPSSTGQRAQDQCDGEIDSTQMI